MGDFINSFGLWITIIGGILGVWAFFESRKYKQLKHPATAFLAIALIALIAFVYIHVPLQTTNTATLTSTPNGHISQNSKTPTIGISPTIGMTPTPTDTPTPTLTLPPKAGTVLYQANWSNGINGWAGGDDWSSTGNMLINNGQQNTSIIIAPYHPGDNNVANYAIEAQIQLNRYTDEGQLGGVDSFGIIVRSPDGQQGYKFAVCASSGFGFSNCGANSHEILISNGQSNIAENPYHPQYNDWHTYRVEVNGNTIKVFIDGGQFLSTTDNTYLSGGQAGLWSNRCQISIRSFKVIAL